MAVKIRLSRHGSKKNPIYFVMVARNEAARDGSFLEKLGQYRPKAVKAEEKLSIDRDRLTHWVGKGAQMTRTVAQLVQISAS